MDVAKRRSDSVGGSAVAEVVPRLRPNTPPPLLLSSEELRAWLAEFALALKMASEVAVMCLVMAR